ncbi:hypothetical protein RDV78_07235 [Bacillota bacterium LX-D]|nr:hypothetical protein [Bacillota bacterium LX-D]
MAYPIYACILALSTAGVPAAISILVAECLAKNDYQGAGEFFIFPCTYLLLPGFFAAVPSSLLLTFWPKKFCYFNYFGSWNTFLGIVPNYCRSIAGFV